MSKLLIATFLSVAAVVPAAAQTATVRVSYADLDLATPAGVATLDRRIAGATAKFCPDRFDHDLLRRVFAERCRRTLIAKVAGQRARAIDAASRRAEVAAANGARSTTRTD